MPADPQPPQAYEDFIKRYPGLGEAWELIARSGAAGPLDPKTMRLIKLAVAAGAMREGAVRSSARKARAQGIAEDAIAQVVALAAGTLGMPSAVAVFSWIEASKDE